MKELSGIERKQPEQLAMMLALPDDPAECNRIGEELWIGLTLRYQQIASVQDVQLLAKPPENPDQRRDYQVALQRFDDYILDQFGVWGPAMLTSREVVRILFRWKSLRPDLFEKMGKQLALHSRIFRGEKSAPLSEGSEEFADAAIVELGILLRRQRDEFHRRPAVTPRCDRIAEWMKFEMEAHPDDFPGLYAHRGQLHGYVRNYLPQRNKKAAQELESGRIRADSLFYQWYAASTNRSARDVRNLISRRRSKKLSSSK